MNARFAAMALVLLAVSTRVDAVDPHIEPADPIEYERIALRQTVDSCSFGEYSVEVRLEGRTIVVLQSSAACIVPGVPRVVDIQLGAFPAGEYRVELRERTAPTPIAVLDVLVSGLYYPQVFPPVPRPIANYTGLWWNGVDAGWGLSLEQGARHALFGSLLMLDANGAPRWYSLQSGRWQTSTRWSGRVLLSGRTSGAVTHTDVGSAVLDFAMTPGREGLGTATFTINGVSSTQDIRRIRL